jgi:hypothetical protein
LRVRVGGARPTFEEWARDGGGGRAAAETGFPDAPNEDRLTCRIRISGYGFQISDFGFQISSFVVQVSGLGFRV